MAILRYLMIIGLVSFSTLTYAQSNEKIEKKLDKLYQKGKITKCEKKALKFKKKNPRAVATYYYLSKLEIYAYKQFPNPPHKKQYTHLRKAANYSKRTKEEYPDWHNEVENIFKNYIYSWDNSNEESAHLNKVKQAYCKYFEDKDISKNSIIETIEEKSPDIEIPKASVNQKRKKIIEVGTGLVGIPYKYAGTSPKTGFDCSGFTQYLYKQVGIDIPHNSHMQSELKGQVIPLEQALPGDLIIFGSGNSKKWQTQHTAIIYENNNGIIKVIHSVSRGVTIDGENSSWESYWKNRVLFVKRIPELN